MLPLRWKGGNWTTSNVESTTRKCFHFKEHAQHCEKIILPETMSSAFAPPNPPKITPKLTRSNVLGNTWNKICLNYYNILKLEITMPDILSTAGGLPDTPKIYPRVTRGKLNHMKWRKYHMKTFPLQRICQTLWICHSLQGSATETRHFESNHLHPASFWCSIKDCLRARSISQIVITSDTRLSFSNFWFQFNEQSLVRMIDLFRSFLCLQLIYSYFKELRTFFHCIFCTRYSYSFLLLWGYCPSCGSGSIRP